MYNRNDAYIGEVFYLYFFGVNVFFEIIESDWDWVSIKELKTRKYEKKTKEMVVYGKSKEDGSCLVIPHTIHNDGKNFRVNTYQIEDVVMLEIKIDKDSELYKAALRINNDENTRKEIEDSVGTLFAVKISNSKNWYNWWYEYKKSDIPPKEVKKNKNIDRIW